MHPVYQMSFSASRNKRRKCMVSIIFILTNLKETEIEVSCHEVQTVENAIGQIIQFFSQVNGKEKHYLRFKKRLKGHFLKNCSV